MPNQTKQRIILIDLLRGVAIALMVAGIAAIALIETAAGRLKAD